MANKNRRQNQKIRVIHARVVNAENWLQWVEPALELAMEQKQSLEIVQNTSFMLL